MRVARPAGDPGSEPGVVGPDELGSITRGTAPGVYERIEEACAVEYPRLVRILTLYCGDREVASDLAQETLARGCAHWRRVRTMENQRAWFTRVALNLANSRWRRLRLERTRLLSLSQQAPAPAGDLALALTLRAAMNTLTPRQRMAVVLRYYEDLDLHSTAQVMGCSDSTAKKLTARGLATLRQYLEPDGTAEGGES